MSWKSRFCSVLSLVSLGLLLAVPCSAAALPPLSMAEALQPPTFHGAVLSPSGRYVAGILDRSDAHALVIWDALDPAVPPAVQTVDWQLQDIAWKSDERLILTGIAWGDDRGNAVPYARARYRADCFGMRSILAMDRRGRDVAFLNNGGNARSGFRSVDHVVDLLLDDADHVVMGLAAQGDLDLFKVNVHDGRAERIAQGSHATIGWEVDRSGEPVLRTDLIGGRALYLFARKPDRSPEPRTGMLTLDQWERIRVFTGDIDSEHRVPEFSVIGPGPDPLTLWVSWRVEGDDTAAIHLYDLRSNRSLKRVKSLPGIDITGALIHPQTGEFVGAIYDDGRRRIDIESPSLRAYSRALADYFGSDADYAVESTSRDGRYWLLSSWGPQDRGSYHFFDLEQRRVNEITLMYPDIAPSRLGRTQIVRYTAADGVPLMGYLTRPPAATARDRPPLIVMPHGGPIARDHYEYDSLVQFLASRGYQVFQPNFRGSAGFGYRFESAGYGQWGEAIRRDISDGMDHLVSAGLADPQRACIVGWSFGGYAALNALTLEPKRYRCAVSIAGISDLTEMLSYDRDRFRGDDYALDLLARELGHPQRDRERLLAQSPITQVNAVERPLLLIHGKTDERVPISQSRQMERALSKAGKRVEAVWIEEMGHDWGLPAQSVQVLDALERFLARELPTSVPAVAGADTSADAAR